MPRCRITENLCHLSLCLAIGFANSYDTVIKNQINTQKYEFRQLPGVISLLGQLLISVEILSISGCVCPGRTPGGVYDSIHCQAQDFMAEIQEHRELAQAGNFHHT